MARFRKIARFINYLLISVFLLLTPVLSYMPVRAVSALGTGYENNSEYGVKNLANNIPDRLQFFSRNCTSFVAYIMRTKGVTYHGNAFMNDWDNTAHLGRWGNATDWDAYAPKLGYVVDRTPAIGAVAQWNAGDTMPWGAAGVKFGSAGHVAYVTNVSGGNVTIEDYNSNGGDFKWGTYTASTATMAANYIHLERPLPGGWWQGNTPTTTLSSNGAVTGRIISANQTISIEAHIEDNGNGGLRSAHITYKNVGAGDGVWHVLQSPIGVSGSSANISRSYTVPSGTKYISISFDVFSHSNAFQEAPMGVRTICTQAAINSGECPRPTKNLGMNDWSPLEGHGGTDSGGGTSSGGSGTSSGCTPGQYQAAVFTDANYGGSCVIKGLGEYRTPEAIGLPNDSISSIRIGSGANVRLCDNSDLNSPCEYFSVDDPELNNNSINTNTVSSMKVEDTAPTTNCVPNQYQVAFFMNENYQETCILRGVGRYNDAGALGLPDNSISSVKVGARVWVRICDNVNNDSPCDQFEYDRPDLTPTTVQNNKASSAEVYLKGGIALCDNDLNDNNGGECRYFGAGDVGENLQNMSSHNFDNRIQSVRYDPDWEGRYHIVLYVDQNQTGALAHYDGTVAALQDPYRNNISSIKIYKNHPPNARALAPANGTIFPATTVSVTLNYTEGQEKRIHIWSNNGYDVTSDWAASETHTLNNLSPGTYSWQAQSRSPIIGEGAWSAVQTFSINTPPVVMGGTLTMDAGTSQSIQVQAVDAESSNITLAASGLPSFATFTDNGNGAGTLALNPSVSQNGQYTITVTANDGSVTGSGVVQLAVAATQPAGYQAEYFSNRTLSGTPVLTRTEAEINNDWGGGSPGSGVGVDNFSARWTKTTDFAAGTYAFSVTADDGVRLYVDNVLVIDKWIDQGATTYTANRTLTAGSHTIKMEYYENGGGAVARMSYQPATSSTPPPPPAIPPTAYTGQYFANRTLSGTPALTRGDNTIDFDWGGSSPGAGVPVDNFSVRWTKTSDFSAGTYRFTATGDDGLRLFVDGQLVIDKWVDQGPTSYTADRTLTAGNHTVVYEYYEAGGGAVARLSVAPVSAPTPPPPPPPTSGTELLSAPWNLVGNNGAAEKYQSISSNALAGKTTLRVTYNLRGLTALGGDASAIIFDQNGWKFVSLSNYGQNGLNGSQTVDIPLSAFGLNLSQPVGTLHTRFWYGGPFTVDITSIQVF